MPNFRSKRIRTVVYERRFGASRLAFAERVYRIGRAGLKSHKESRKDLSAARTWLIGKRKESSGWMMFAENDRLPISEPLLDDEELMQVASEIDHEEGGSWSSRLGGEVGFKPLTDSKGYYYIDLTSHCKQSVFCILVQRAASEDMASLVRDLNLALPFIQENLDAIDAYKIFADTCSSALTSLDEQDQEIFEKLAECISSDEKYRSVGGIEEIRCLIAVSDSGFARLEAAEVPSIIQAVHRSQKGEGPAEDIPFDSYEHYDIRFDLNNDASQFDSLELSWLMELSCRRWLEWNRADSIESAPFQIWDPSGKYVGGNRALGVDDIEEKTKENRAWVVLLAIPGSDDDQRFSDPPSGHGALHQGIVGILAIAVKIGKLTEELDGVTPSETENPAADLFRHYDILRLQQMAGILSLTIEGRRFYRSSLTDDLTGLWNRAALKATYDKWVNGDSSSRRDTPLGIIFLDVDEFKSINSKFGYQGGDRVIQAIGKMLVAAANDEVGDDDRFRVRVFRQGGDEFVLLVEQNFPPTEAPSFLDELVDRVQEYARSIRGLDENSRDELREIAPAGIGVSIGYCTRFRSELIEVEGEKKAAGSEIGNPRIRFEDFGGAPDSEVDATRREKGIFMASRASRVSKASKSGATNWADIEDLAVEGVRVIELLGDDRILIDAGREQNVREGFLFEIFHDAPSIILNFPEASGSFENMGLVACEGEASESDELGEDAETNSKSTEERRKGLARDFVRASVRLRIERTYKNYSVGLIEEREISIKRLRERLEEGKQSEKSERLQADTLEVSERTEARNDKKAPLRAYLCA